MPAAECRSRLLIASRDEGKPKRVFDENPRAAKLGRPPAIPEQRFGILVCCGLHMSGKTVLSGGGAGGPVLAAAASAVAGRSLAMDGKGLLD